MALLFLYQSQEHCVHRSSYYRHMHNGLTSIHAEFTLGFGTLLVCDAYYGLVDTLHMRRALICRARDIDPAVQDYRSSPAWRRGGQSGDP